MSRFVLVTLIIFTIVLCPATALAVWKSLKAPTATDRAILLLLDVVLTGSQWVVLLYAWGLVR